MSSEKFKEKTLEAEDGGYLKKKDCDEREFCG